ncbi:MAG TPA: ABC transporter permease subunit [Candidatus Obscuribacterales bacterium]
MFKLLEIELRKLVPYRFFWLSVIAYALLMPALFVSLHNLNITIRTFTLNLNFYNFPDVWHNSVYIAKWFNFLLYVFVLQVVTNEYQFRTIRQNIIDGLSPWQYLTGKVLLLVLFALCSTLLVGALGLYAGMFLSENHDTAHMWEKTEYLGLYFAQLLGYLSMALMIGTLVRKSGMAVLAFTGYILVVEAVLRYAPFMSSFQPKVWGPYLPSQVLGTLIPNPLPAYFGIGQPAVVDPNMIGISVAYTLAFVLVSGMLIARKDL